MKYSVKIIFILILFCSSNIFSQTKEESIRWLKEKLPMGLALNPEFYKDLEIKSISECEIVVTYTDNKSNHYLVTYATRDINTVSTKDSKLFSYNKIDGALQRKNGVLEHYFVDLLQIKDAYLDGILSHMEQLSAYCKNNERLDWKAGNEAEAKKWLEATFKKYAYTADSHFFNPRVELINSCKIVFACDYYESGFDWGESEKLGTVTETIYMDANEIAGSDNCFRSERKEIFHKYSHDKDKIYAESYRSAVGVKQAYPELHDNVLKTMKFLNKNCDCGFICRMTERTSEQGTATGNKAPEFLAPDPNGRQVALYESLGTYTILHFWASWNKADQQENANLGEIYKLYRSKGLNIIGVSLDKEMQSWKNAISNQGLSWPQVSSLKLWNEPVAKLYGVKSIPTIYILDKEGKIIKQEIRGYELKKYVQGLFE